MGEITTRTGRVMLFRRSVRGRPVNVWHSKTGRFTVTKTRAKVFFVTDHQTSKRWTASDLTGCRKIIASYGGDAERVQDKWGGTTPDATEAAEARG
jgi:ABC-type hemin transport system substrate-binding protein